MEAERLAAADRTLVPEPVRRPPPSRRPGRLRRHDRLARLGAGRWRAGVRPSAALHARRPAAGRPRRRSRRGTRRHPGRWPGSPTRSPDTTGATRRPDRKRRLGQAVRLRDEPVGPMARPTRWSSPSPARRRRAPRLRVIDPDGGQRVCEFDGSRPDDRPGDRQRPRRCPTAGSPPPRPHRRAGAGTLVYTDLGSTNGSRVNGVAVSELVLGAGDRIELGDTVIVVEVGRGSAD